MTPHPQRCETCSYGRIEKDKEGYTHRYCSHPDFQYRAGKESLMMGTEIFHIQRHGCMCHSNHSSPPAATDTDRHDPRIELRRICEQEERDATIRNQTLDDVLAMQTEAEGKEVVMVNDIESLRTPSTKEQP